MPTTRSPRLPVRPVALAVAAASVLAAVPAAAAAPPPPGLTASAPSPTRAAEATFSWSASPAEVGGSVRYEGGIGDELTDFGTALSAARALPEGRVVFRVRSVETDPATGADVASAFSTVELTVDRTAPVISGAAPSGWRRSPVAVTFTCDGTGSAITACGPSVTVTREGAGQSVTGTATDAAGNTATTTVGPINIDRSAPTSPVITGPAEVTPDRRPLIEWVPATDAISRVVGYQVYIDTPTRTRAAAFTTTPSYRPPANLAPGPHTIFVRAVDAADNGTNSELRRFTIADPAAPGAAGSSGAGVVGGAAAVGGPVNSAAPPAPEETTTGSGRTVARPPTENATRLRPRAGLRLRTLRPVLRWTRTPRGTTLVNVQVFRMRGRTLTKIHSAFPRSRAYRLPGGLLRPGGTYVWRVWPYRGRRGFTPKPLGVSWFRASGLADLLPAAARARMLAPTGGAAARATALPLRWVARPGVRRYKVTLERGGRPVFSRLAVGTTLTVPGRALRRAGTYAVLVRSARRGAPRRFVAVPWAAAAVRVR